MGWEKTSVLINEATNKGLIYKVYKQLTQQKKQTVQSKNGQKT